MNFLESLLHLDLPRPFVEACSSGYTAIFESKETKMEKAAVLIKEFLSDGDVRSVDMYRRLKEAGIGHKTAEMTKKEIGIRCYRKMKQWYWSLNTE